MSSSGVRRRARGSTKTRGGLRPLDRSCSPRTPIGGTESSWMRRNAARTVLAVGLVTMVVVSCSSSERPATPATPTSSPTGSPPPPEGTATPSPSPAGVEAIEVDVEVEDGRVDGPGRVRVPQGASVELRVRADVVDEVHVHGYDLFADVSPGTRAEIVFRADAAGVFEVELEEAGILLVRLEVVP